MEAEAQCAALVSLGLVDGVITDDSDVFLFGADCVFKNMFNQSKTVECFFSRDLARELGLKRDTLVRLAYLLGSDYVDGLPGVGPVVAMELLKEFPGEDGLHKFKDWWLRVQTGRDTEEESISNFRRHFVSWDYQSYVAETDLTSSLQKKKFKDLYLPNEWPNPAVVSRPTFLSFRF
jgi:DNA excision repair protein ERCC-5